MTSFETYHTEKNYIAKQMFPSAIKSLYCTNTMVIENHGIQISRFEL